MVEQAEVKHEKQVDKPVNLKADIVIFTIYMTNDI